MDLKGKRILLTGASGFLGQYVYRELLRQGVSFTTILRPTHTECDWAEEAWAREHFGLLAAGGGLFNHRGGHIDIVIHLAAQVGGIGANLKTPGTFFYENMAMGLNLIETARRRGTDKFLQVGTVCSYPKHADVPFKESALWDGYPEETNAPYGIAKKALLVMLQAYRQQYGFNGIYLIPVNLYGPGDNFDLQTSHVIPAMINKFCYAVLTGSTEVILWGTGKVSREFLFVADAARAIVMALQKYDKPEPVNVGTGREITIADLAEKIAELTGFTGDIVWDHSKPDGQPRRRLDVTAAKEQFGFEAGVSLEDGLKQTVDWYKNN